MPSQHAYARVQTARTDSPESTHPTDPKRRDDIPKTIVICAYSIAYA